MNKEIVAALGVVFLACTAGYAQNTPTLSIAATKVGITSGQNGAASNFKFYMEASGWPHAVTQGETVFMMGTWPTGKNPTMSDDKSNTWASAVSCSDSQGLSHGMFYAANAAANTSVLTETHSSAIQNTVFDWAHFYNMATTNVTDGSSCKTGVTPASNTAPNITGNAYTTAVSGDLILTCVYVESGTLGTPNPISSITWPSGFTGLGEDISYGHACAYGIGSGGSFTPTITVAQGTHNSFSIVSAAFKAGNGGSAPGAGATVLLSEMYYSPNSGQTATLNLPCPSGTTAVVAATDAGGLTGVSDSGGSSWTHNPIVFSGWGPQWYTNNPTVSGTNSYTVSLHMGGNLGGYDLVGLFCLGGTGGVDTGVTAANSSSLDGSGSGTTSNTATNFPTFTDVPSMNPSVAGDLVIGSGAMGVGPVNSCVAGQCVFDYVGSTTWTVGDNESYANGDVMAHQYAPTTATVNFEYSAPQSSSGSVSAMAIAFKPAIVMTPPAPPTGLQAVVK